MCKEFSYWLRSGINAVALINSYMFWLDFFWRRKVFQQWRIFQQCACSVYLDVSNPFSSFTVTVSGQVCSPERVSGIGFQFCGYFNRSINTTAVISRPTNKYKLMAMKLSYLWYVSFYDKQKQVTCHRNTSLASNLDVGNPAICLKPPVFFSQVLPILHTYLPKPTNKDTWLWEPLHNRVR